MWGLGQLQNTGRVICYHEANGLSSFSVSGPGKLEKKAVWHSYLSMRPSQGTKKFDTLILSGNPVREQESLTLLSGNPVREQTSLTLIRKPSQRTRKFDTLISSGNPVREQENLTLLSHQETQSGNKKVWHSYQETQSVNKKVWHSNPIRKPSQWTRKFDILISSGNPVREQESLTLLS